MNYGFYCTDCGGLDYGHGCRCTNGPSRGRDTLRALADKRREAELKAELALIEQRKAKRAKDPAQ